MQVNKEKLKTKIKAPTLAPRVPRPPGNEARLPKKTENEQVVVSRKKKTDMEQVKIDQRERFNAFWPMKTEPLTRSTKKTLAQRRFAKTHPKSGQYPWKMKLTMKPRRKTL